MRLSCALALCGRGPAERLRHSCLLWGPAQGGSEAPAQHAGAGGGSREERARARASEKAAAKAAAAEEARRRAELELLLLDEGALQGGGRPAGACQCCLIRLS